MNDPPTIARVPFHSSRAQSGTEESETTTTPTTRNSESASLWSEVSDSSTTTTADNSTSLNSSLPNCESTDAEDDFEDDHSRGRNNCAGHTTASSTSGRLIPLQRHRDKLISDRHRLHLRRFAPVRRTLRQAPRIRNRPDFLYRLDRFLYRMCVFIARYHKEVCIGFLVVASGLASLRTGPPKTRSVEAPGPFFTQTDANKYLHDYFQGEYVDLVQNKIPFSPSFIFYYAPWDSESVAAKEVFLRVAQYFHTTRPGQVKFYAVNCWWPDGQCRQNYKNLSHYPIFVGHIGMHAGIIYSGPIREELMIRFLNSILKPLTRLDSEEELWRFRAEHDAIVLGYFNFTQEDGDEAYETYLQMALRNLEADPFGQVGFGLFLKPELAEKFFLSSSTYISLVLFNEIHTAKWHGGVSNKGFKGPVPQVAEWVIDRTRRTPLTWAYRVRSGFSNKPVALGPVDFADEMKKGPVFLLVTKRYFPSAYSPFYAQVKEVALDYFNCNNSGNVTKLRRITHKINSDWTTLIDSISKVCQSSKHSSNCKILGDQVQHWNDKRKAFKKESLAHYENVSAAMNFTGFSCTTDRPFKFFSVDPVDVPHFISLGLGGLGYNSKSDPLALILDVNNDIILPFSNFNISELARVIHNYTISSENGNFDHFSGSRLFWEESRSKIVKSPATKSGDANMKNLRNLQKRSKSMDSGSPVRQFSSSELVSYVKGEHPFQEPSSLLLMYTARFCGFCGAALSHFINLARFITNFYIGHGVNITLAKIDTFVNSFPDHLTPKDIPSVVFFPEQNRSDGRIFPPYEQITTKTLLRFLLSELDPESRVAMSLQAPLCKDETCKELNGHCSDRQMNSSTYQCLRENKVLVSEQIHSLLERLRDDLGVKDTEVEIDDGQRSSLSINSGEIAQWRSQVLEHLRSMKLILDVA